jgi:hypothetical protein
MKSSKTFWILSLILIGLLLFFFFYKHTNEGLKPIRVQGRSAVRGRGGGGVVGQVKKTIGG